MLKASKRLNFIEEYYFSKKLKEIDDLKKMGRNIINLGIGSPDLPPHSDVIKSLNEFSSKDEVHGYQSYRGLSVLREAFSRWYKEFYRVNLNPETEILPLIGSKEGIVHLSMALLDAGDVVLVPNPGYPAYKAAAKLAGAECIEYELCENNNWFPDLDFLEQIDLKNIKIMWINYPNMPTGQLPTKEFFKKIIEFGKANDILICHDNPYSFILNDNPLSILEIDNAMDYAVELNSLSKSHNMAGWRMGMLAGNKDLINTVLQFKSNLDSGMFLPIQMAAVKALSLTKEWFGSLNDIYKKRREKVFELVELLNCTYEENQGGMFVWAKLNNGDDCYSFTDKILNKADVFITPGGIFGSAGNNYIRISLCASENIFQEAINKIKKSL